jgi:hypothetical protein
MIGGSRQQQPHGLEKPALVTRLADHEVMSGQKRKAINLEEEEEEEEQDEQANCANASKRKRKQTDRVRKSLFRVENPSPYLSYHQVPCVYQNSWAQIFPHTRKGDTGDCFAHCTACNTEINLTSRGKTAIRDHQRSAYHQNSVDKITSLTTQPEQQHSSQQLFHGNPSRLPLHQTGSRKSVNPVGSELVSINRHALATSITTKG